MPSRFLENYMQGWQMGMSLNESRRRDQELQMEQQRQQAMEARWQQQAKWDMESHDIAVKTSKMDLEKAKLNQQIFAHDFARGQGAEQGRQQLEASAAPGGQFTRPGAAPIPGMGEMAGPPAEGVPTQPAMVQVPGIDAGGVSAPAQTVPGIELLKQLMARRQQELRVMAEEAAAKRAPAKSPEEIQDEAFARARGERMGNPPQPRAEPQGSWQEGTGPDGKPILYNALTGESKPYPAGVTPKSGTDKPPTSVQSRALKFWERGSDALKNIERPVSKDPNSPTLEQFIAKTGTAAQFWMGYAHNSLLTPEQRRYIQAAKSFTEARLRQDSGAAIPPYEYKNDLEMFFIQPGDDPASIEQKRQSRLSVLNALKGEAGRAYTQNYGDIGNGNNPSSPSRPGVTINGVLVEEE